MFTYGYDGVTSRLGSVAYPNGQQALYSYLEDNMQDRRLAEIKHLTPAGAVLDQFDYVYDGPLGRIATWNQQQPGASVGSIATNAYALTYDAIGRLLQAVLNGDSTNPGGSVWNYDPAGNRVGVQSGSGTLSTAVPTSTNSLFSLNGGGSVFVAGTLSKWANVTVNGVAALLNATNNAFETFVPLPIGTQTISISATDVDGNTATSRYQLTISAGAGESFAYDANGNTTALTPTAAGTTSETLEWDGLDRVTAINYFQNFNEANATGPTTLMAGLTTASIGIGASGIKDAWTDITGSLTNVWTYLGSIFADSATYFGDNGCGDGDDDDFWWEPS